VLFIWQFALDDLRNKYSNSFLGIAWGFVQPLTTIIVYWFVFQVGFKSQPVENFPFILWLIVGLLPWFYVSEVIPSSTSVLTEYSYLVQKVMFNIDILPIVKVVSTFLIHVFLLLLAFVAFIISGYRPSVYYIQVLYYSVYMVVLTVGISYIVSALYIFVKDLIQIVSIILQIIFWATPIVWDMSTMPESVQNVLKYNPLYFVVNGYRKTFIYKELFWKDGLINLYYWAIAIIVLFIGMKLFHKLKPHFADVL
jgi:ABC-type polysaccharide/polyol phosphate export permease